MMDANDKRTKGLEGAPESTRGGGPDRAKEAEETTKGGRPDNSAKGAGEVARGGGPDSAKGAEEKPDGTSVTRKGRKKTTGRPATR